jgi:TolA-binding protein
MNNPLTVYLAEEVAALHSVNDAQRVVMQDTAERLRMCMGEIRRLNGALDQMEEQLQACRNVLTEEMALNTRLSLENKSMKGIIDCMKKGLDRYRSYAKNKADRPRSIPPTFHPYLRPNRSVEENVTIIRRQLQFEDMSDVEEEPVVEEVDVEI